MSIAVYWSDCAFGKGNCCISPRLADTDSDGAPVSVGFDGGQAIDGIVAEV